LASLTDLSIYIHIPFCVKRCRYCDFYSEAGAGSDVIRRTLDALVLSLDRGISRLRPERTPTVFIGGGTPSLIPPRMLDSFLGRLESLLGGVEEFSIEVNPESLSREFLEVCGARNVNRISMGVQSYNDTLLSWLGRPAGRDALERADGLLSSYWDGRLSRDILAGLPSPGDITGDEDVCAEDRLSADLERALRDKPGHISLYELTVEEGTPLASSSESLEVLPEELFSLNEGQKAVRFLAERGYRRYEVSNYALEGFESRHNLNYWRMKPYLGVGPGASSTFPLDVQASGSESPQRVIRGQEPRNLHSWLKNPTGSLVEEVLKPGELALEHFMMGLRTAEGISVERFESIFGIRPADAVPRSVERWESAGMLVSDSSALRPSSRGMELLDSLLADIALEADKVDWGRFCRWPQP
jgi:oxygen-independent coproporphyrinogen-3 oxidase